MSWSAPEDWSRWDPERLLVCPYDEVHMIKAKRFQHHLLKCRKNHPEKDFVNCPFNAKHVMLRSEVRHHVSRCPDRSAIEQYNYKGSEKDEDGFYFKGNTSVPSYHKTEELQEPMESWDTDVDSNLQWAVHNNTNRPQSVGGLAQSPHTVTDTLSLSPEEREKFKRQMRREAALRSVNSGIQLPSGRWSHAQEPNRCSDNRELRQHPVSANPVFHHCTEQGALSNSSVQEAHTAQSTGAFTNTASKPKNPIFEYCVGQMQTKSENASEQNRLPMQPSQCETNRNLVLPCGANENAYFQQTANRTPTSSAPDTMELRSGYIETEMETKLTSHTARNKPEVAAVSNVCGQPTSPTSSGANGPQLAGVGRARLLAEARKNNFGGICFSPTKTTGLEAKTRTTAVGRGRGMLNYAMYSS